MELIDLKLSLSQLLLDPSNYRLDYDRNIRSYDDDEIIEQQIQTQKRLEKERLGELRESMIQNGFLEMDRIVVRELQSNDNPNLYVVVEGNRRAAAFKGLIEDYHEGLIDLPDSLVEKSESISVICISGSPDDISNYSAGLMGIRHVSGPKKWTGYQSARLINELYNTNKSFDYIGSLLGISANDAERRMNGYRAFLQMRNDNDYGEKTKTKHYTLLLEFLAQKKVGRDWLEWDDEELQFNNKVNLNRLYSAITSVDNQRPEINNPTNARDFLNHLEIDEDRKKIEEGVRLQDLMSPHDINVSISKQLTDFLKLVSTLDSQNLDEEELNYLNSILSSVQDIITNGMES